MNQSEPGPGELFVTLKYDILGELISVQYYNGEELVAIDNKNFRLAAANEPPPGELKGIRNLGDMYYYYDEANEITKKCVRNNCRTYC